MTCRILILEDVPFDVELMEREIRLSGIEFTSMTVDNEKDYLEALETSNLMLYCRSFAPIL